MSCIANAANTLDGAAQSAGAARSVGALAVYPPGAQMVRNHREVREMIAAIKRAGEHGEQKPCLGEPKELLAQLQSVLDGKAKPRDLVPVGVKPNSQEHQVYGWLTGQPWTQLDAYLPHRGLRGCVITRQDGQTVIRKVMGDGTLQPTKPGTTPTEITAWLTENDFVQTGALVKHAGEREGEGAWMVCFLRRWDSPELLSGVPELLPGDSAGTVVPATLGYYPAEDKIATTRTRRNIQRARHDNRFTDRDLGIVELPPLQARLKMAGLI